MKALLYTQPMHSVFTEVDEAKAGHGQSLIEVAYCGICGSDMHAWRGHDERRIPPLVLGHEASGTVISGPDQGKKVVINPLMTCGQCPACSSGNTHLCPKRELIGMRLPGAFAQRVAINNENLVPLSDHLPLNHAALAEPLSCALHTVHLMMDAAKNPARDHDIIILGGGTIGLLSALVLEHYGYTHIWVGETHPIRRQVLEKSCQATIYDPSDNHPVLPKTIDVVIDSVGSGTTRIAACNLVKPGGIIIHIGLQNNEPGLDARRITLQEITFKGVYCYRQSDFLEAVKLIEEGVISAGDWVQTRSLVEGPQAFTDIHSGKAPVKIILNINQ